MIKTSKLCFVTTSPSGEMGSREIEFSYDEAKFSSGFCLPPEHVLHLWSEETIAAKKQLNFTLGFACAPIGFTKPVFEVLGHGGPVKTHMLSVEIQRCMSGDVGKVAFDPNHPTTPEPVKPPTRRFSVVK
jgi:hypothetical protein